MRGRAGVSVNSETTSGDGRLVGRQAEVSAVRTAIADLRTGEFRLLTVSGEPGIGKTRLLSETATLARHSGLTVLAGRASEQRPSWGYQRLLGRRLAVATAALDIQTGGGEVLAGAGSENFPPTLVAALMRTRRSASVCKRPTHQSPALPSAR